MPDSDIDITSESFDQKTGLMRQETLEKVDPVKLERAVDQSWDSFSERTKKEWERRYEAAPKSEKTGKMEDGEPMTLDAKDWFKAKYSPAFAERTRVSYRGTGKKDIDIDLNWNNLLPGKDKTGGFSLDPWRETVAFGVTSPGSDTPEMLEYNSEMTVPLQGVFPKSFTMPTTVHTVDAKTGVKADQATAVDNRPVSITVAPIAKSTISFTDSKGKAWTFTPGDIIPADIQREMDKKDLRDQYIFEAFINSKVDYSQQPTNIIISDIKLGKKIQSYDQTNRMPLREAKRYLEEAARHQKLDVKPLFTRVDEVLNFLNNNDAVFNKKKSEEDEYENIYKN
jgi:hypothetical protein